MSEKKCWICGGDIPQSAAGKSQAESFYLDVHIVLVNRPYHENYKWKPVKICPQCSREKVGLTHDGKNLNRRADDE